MFLWRSFPPLLNSSNLDSVKALTLPPLSVRRPPSLSYWTSPIFHLVLCSNIWSHCILCSNIASNFSFLSFFYYSWGVKCRTMKSYGRTSPLSEILDFGLAQTTPKRLDRGRKFEANTLRVREKDKYWQWLGTSPLKNRVGETSVGGVALDVRGSQILSILKYSLRLRRGKILVKTSPLKDRGGVVSDVRVSLIQRHSSSQLPPLTPHSPNPRHHTSPIRISPRISYDIFQHFSTDFGSPKYCWNS